MDGVEEQQPVVGYQNLRGWCIRRTRYTFSFVVARPLVVSGGRTDVCICSYSWVGDEGFVILHGVLCRYEVGASARIWPALEFNVPLVTRRVALLQDLLHRIGKCLLGFIIGLREVDIYIYFRHFMHRFFCKSSPE